MSIKTHFLFLLTAAASLTTSMAQDDPLSQWSWRNPVPGGPPRTGIAYGTNLHVAVGDSGSILTSPDGTNWTSRPSGVYNALNAVVYANNQFVAVGGAVTLSDPSDTILTSPDGVAWTTGRRVPATCPLGLLMARASLRRWVGACGARRPLW